ncbi:Major facilitator superfamily transporter [Pleurostoma richardsiae]|uniref:Major facilitator superfamily transporter n=1 Tax=Pleurostoma richardsiae TaxID=41990 RepID=A0AA38RJ02_9PEZI|nr:Major facilitator superfamily transporter [Pleurostoma richardsiae]
MATQQQLLGEAKPDRALGNQPESDSATEVADKNAQPHLRDTIPRWRWVVVLVVFCFSMIMNGYDVSNVANIQAPIYEAFGHIELLPWVALTYSMACMALTPLIRRLIEIFDMRVLIVIFYVIFLVSCAVSGSATNIHAVIVGRALTGLGNNCVYQLNLTFVALFCDARQASKLAGIIGIAWAIGLVAGPLVGGGFANNHHLTWRWAFYINLPFLGALTALAAIAWPTYTIRKGTKLSAKLTDIDWIGATLHIAVTLLLNAALNLSGSQWKWKSGSTIALWVVTGITIVVYILQQYFAIFTTQKQRIFPVRVLTHRTAGLASLGAALTGMIYAVTLYYLPLFFAFARGTSPISSAVHILPFIGVFIGSTIISSVLLAKVRLYASYYVISGALVVAGGALMTQIDAETPTSKVLGYQALLGFGIGLTYSNSYSVANASLDSPEDKVDSAGLFNMASLGSISIALSLASCLYQNLGFSLLSDRLRGFGFTPQDIREALGGVKSPVLAADNEQIVGIVVSTVTEVISRIFYLVVAVGALCLLTGLAMKWERLDFAKVERKKGTDDSDTEGVGASEKARDTSG